MTLFKKICCSFVLVSLGSTLSGMTYDNRFLPLLKKPDFRSQDAHFFINAQPFYMFASDTQGSGSEEVGLFGGIYGQYNQLNLNRALIKIGQKNTLPLLSHGVRNILWSTGGHFDAAGCALTWYYRLSPHWEIGGSGLVIGARSRLEPILLDNELDLSILPVDGQIPLPGNKADKAFLNAQAAEMRLDGLHGNFWNNTGIGDLDFYLRWGMLRNYFLRFKTFDAGLKLGCIIPTASARDLDYLSSIPFGGNKHWGIYVDAALDTELKDDLYAGLNIRFIQRLPRTQEMRFPLNDEPLNFGVLKAPFKISPALTFVFSPYCVMKEWRDGFGAAISYTLITHGRDNLSLESPAVHINESDFERGSKIFRDLSKWSSEYITCSLTYDFAKNKECRGATPWASLDIDIPVSILTAKQSFRTYGISLRIESNLW